MSFPASPHSTTQGLHVHQVYRFYMFQGECVVAITSGSNINFERLRLVAELAELGSNAEHMLASTISGAPGSLQAFVETATTNKENITELRHR